MTVLVLAEECDPTADAVVHALQQREVPVFRCDTSWFPVRLSVDAVLGETGWAGALRTEHQEVALSGLRSIWYRSPTAFVFPGGLSGPERRHAALEAKLGLGGVLWSLPVLWVNHPAKAADTYKPTQLHVARRLGLTVPRTLVTNRPEAVLRFAATCDGRVVVKPLGSASIVEAGGRRPLYTRPLNADDLVDLHGVEVTAHLFQQRIDKACEVRLTVIGGRMLAAAIHAGSDAARADFRADYGALTYDTVDVPGPVAAGLRAFMRHFGLVFGAFDFAVDEAGTWWMFECNPGGQWAWIEDTTGLPITETLVDLLQEGKP
ncbi:MAG: ATP-grasp ribosomal peptide maturase [Micromonosporaceae bacterium]|nr:ATP-grasp ribosomal peptide maturase [Micromonosporaceae bacterium]